MTAALDSASQSDVSGGNVLARSSGSTFLIAHPYRHEAYWTGCGWAASDGPVMRFLDYDSALWEMNQRLYLSWTGPKIVEEPEYIPDGYHLVEDLDGERFVKNDPQKIQEPER